MKYELTDEVISRETMTLYRIRALKDFHRVKAGDLGGFVESTDNLSQEGNCWVANDAKVFGQAKVYGDARICGTAKVFGTAEVYGDAEVFGSARIYDQAKVYGDAVVTGEAQIYDIAEVYEKAVIRGTTHVYGWSKIFGIAEVSEEAQVYAHAEVYGISKIRGRAKVLDHAKVKGSIMDGQSKAYGESFLVDSRLFDNAKVFGSTYAILSSFADDAVAFNSYVLKSGISGSAEVQDSTISDANIKGKAWVMNSLVMNSLINGIHAIQASFVRFCQIQFFKTIKNSRIRCLELATGGTLDGADVSDLYELVTHSGYGRYGKTLTLYTGFSGVSINEDDPRIPKDLHDRVFKGFNLTTGLGEMDLDARIAYAHQFERFKEISEDLEILGGSLEEGSLDIATKVKPHKPLLINTGCFTGNKQQFYAKSEKTHENHPEVAEEYRTLIEMHQTRLNRIRG